MSKAIELRELAQSAEVFEVQGASDTIHVFFFFPDKSVCVADISDEGPPWKYVWHTRSTKAALRDCGATGKVHGYNTRGRGQELLERIHKELA